MPTGPTAAGRDIEQRLVTLGSGNGGDVTDPRIACAQMQGVARRFSWHRVSESAALAEFAAITADLEDAPGVLAEAAGVLQGGQVQPEERDGIERAVALLVLAGADVKRIPGWTQEGRRRAEVARQLPFSGGAR